MWKSRDDNVSVAAFNNQLSQRKKKKKVLYIKKNLIYFLKGFKNNFKVMSYSF